MRTLQLFIAGAMLLFSAAVFADGKKTTETVKIKTVIYCDHCKKCESCGPKFYTNLYNQPGIKKVELDDKEMIVTVIYNPQKTNAYKIRQFISKQGFDADNVKADPDAYSKLDGCCKK